MPALRLECIGIMGGMFDPVHLGHLDAANQLHKLLQLDKVLMIPCGSPVHRPAGQATAQQRCAMLGLAIAPVPWLEVDQRECDTTAPSWTYTTLAALRKEHPLASLNLLMGMDAFLNLPSWYRWQELFDLAHIVVSARPGSMGTTSQMAAPLREIVNLRQTTKVEQLRELPSGLLYLAQIDTPDLSSTVVRNMIMQSESLAQVLPQAVAAYIIDHQLYRK